MSEIKALLEIVPTVPFLKNQAKNGSAGATVSKHTEDVCMPPNNPKCLYHPSLPKFEEIKA
jgi:hypothetical protein